MELLSCLVYGTLIVGSHCLPVYLFEGDKCKNTDGYGVCTKILKCPAALKQLKQKHCHNFTRCGFDNFTEIVCCPQEDSIRISEKMCNNYKNGVYNGTTTRIRSRILGGEDAVELEFPHMVALGYYNIKKETYSFLCGSTLISDKYIVTAAHCTEPPRRTVLKIARMGSVMVPLETTEVGSAFHDYNIKRTIKHPQFSTSKANNDIALLELEQKVVFSKSIRPACLYARNDDPIKMVILGWGRLGFKGLPSTILQKTNVFPTPNHECAKIILERFNLVVDSGQICAKSPTGDTCAGDSGGPLQIEGENVTMLVGVISYGDVECGGPIPGVYVRIHSYLEWIENIVWNSFEH